MDILNEKIKGLVTKADKSGMPYNILKKVYDRGMAAWKTGHRPGTTPQQWAFARVNSFVTKSSGTWGKADKDLADKVRGAKKEEIENPKKAKDIVGQVKEKLGKDADAGDYVKDFKKSDAPQFKGKSDKKKEKMAVAAYLDSKEEVEVKEGTWELPKTSKQKAGLKHAMKIPIKLGKEGQNARNVIGPFIGDDVLFDDLMDAGDKNPRGDARPIIKKAMKRLGIKEEVKEENCPKCDDDPCKCENIQESGHTDVASMKTQVQIATDALQKMNTELGKLGDEDDLPTWWTNKVATAVNKLDGMADYIDAMHDRGKEMNEDNIQEKERTYTVIHIKKGKEIIKTSKGTYDAAKKYAKMKGLRSTAGVDVHLMEDNITEETVFVVRFEKEGMRFAVPFRDMKMAKDGEKILKKSAGVSGLSITKDVLKPGIKFSRKEGRIVKEENLMEIDGTIFINTRNSNISKQLAYHLRYDLPSEFRDIPLELDGGEQGDTRFIMQPDMDTRDVKKFAAYLKKKYRNGIELELEGVEQEEWMLDENSLATQASRVISQTAIKEKKDPADIDFTATDLDRKAADKNIFVQLKRAQDMKGKGDVEFLDKKKKKVDIRIINKAIDMMMKMKPADRAKMQTAIGKSYKDLLKTVQRGKV